eukprot:CAMPEP_0172743664 /NCGR_PEP_ID=MMETSP1074-20121228/132856_1 /TAXON_ID=2916 /ORGANISM="Ceratium fusus, Strain PA161109" /LENGTH=367 /DNA_ID=CAMNT_0013574427 /DNA_START=23 /DNA_END=1126 /DNA_ORIENTATION=-
MEEVKLPECGPSLVSVGELHKQLETRDSRLSAVETNLRNVQNSIQIWSTIIQDGLADLSVQVKVASQDGRFMQHMHLGRETGDDSAISKRLSEMEQKMEAIHTNVPDSPPLVARLAKAEQTLQELQANVQEVFVKFLPEVQDRQEGPSRSSDMFGVEPNSRSLSVQNLSSSIPVTAALSASQQSIRSLCVSTVHDPAVSPKSTIVDSLGSSHPQLPPLNIDRVQQLLTRPPLLHQLPIGPKSQTARGYLSHQPQDKDGGGLTMLPLNRMQTATQPSQQQSWVANGMPIKCMRGCDTSALSNVNQQVAALVSPGQQHRTIRESYSGQHLYAASPHPGTVALGSNSIQTMPSVVAMSQPLQQQPSYKDR